MFRARGTRIRRRLAPVSETDTFRLEIVVHDDDIDALGHASNIAFVRWIQDVAIAHSTAVGLGIGAYQRLGAIFVVVRQEIDYVRPALCADVVEARTWISSVMAAKCLRRTELVRSKDAQVLARALTTWGFVALDNGRPRRITADVRAAFEPYIQARP
jgi:acyl-CoA thioester hydrolase